MKTLFNTKHVLFFFLTLNFSFNLLGQSPPPPPVNNPLLDINQSLRDLFSPLSRPTPVLDYLYDMTGHVTDEIYWTHVSYDTSNTDNWYRMYWEHFYMSYDTSTLQNDEEIYESVLAFGRDTIPFGVLDFTYYKLIDDALITNDYFDFDTINDLISDIENRTGEPYDRFNLFTAAPLYNVGQYNKITWVITPGYIFSDGINEQYYDPINYQFSIDFGDGNGYQIFDPTITTYHTVDYAGIEGKVILDAVISQDGNPLKRSRSSFMLGKTGTPPRRHDEVLSYNGLPVYVYRSCETDPENRKVIVYLEGIDILDAFPKLNRDAGTIFNEMLKVPNISQLMNFGYDIYIVDWPNSRIDMHDNAMKIVDLLDALKGEIENDHEFVIIGESMGGIIARYALCYMESQNYLNSTYRPTANRRERMHNCRLMITLDSPHQGANIPISLQHFYSSISGSGSIFGMPNQIKLIARHFNLFLDGMAARQLLLYHIDTKEGSGLYKSYTEHEERGEFLSDLSALGNYPQFCKKMAVSNGALNGELQTQFYALSDRSPNDKILDFETELFAKILWFHLPILGADIELKTNPDGQGQVFQFNAGTWGIRLKFYWFGVNIITGYNSLFNISEYADVEPYCVNPGGYFIDGLETVVGKSTDNKTPWNLSKYSLLNVASFRSGSDGSGCWSSQAHIGLDGFSSANYNLSICSDGMHFGFVPLFSALDLNRSGLGLTTLHDDIESNYIPSVIMNNTPFDVVVANGENDDGFMGSHNLNRGHLYVKYEDDDNGQNILKTYFSYRDCDPNHDIYGHWINREIGDEIMYLDNLDCSRNSTYEAQYELLINTFNNPWYNYAGGSSGRTGFYSKSNDFVIRDNINADFRYDLASHNPPLDINYVFNPSTLQGSSPYDGTWTDNTNSAPLACTGCEDFGKKASDRRKKEYTREENTSFAHVYPNPNTSGQVFVSYSFVQSTPVTITITDLFGRNVYSKSINNAKSVQKVGTAILLDGYSFAKGVYFIQVSNGNESFINKLIIN